MKNFYVGIGLLLSMSMSSHVTVSRDTPVDRTFLIGEISEEGQDALNPVGGIVVPQELIIIIVNQVNVEPDPEDTDQAGNWEMRGNPLNRHPDAY